MDDLSDLPMRHERLLMYKFLLETIGSGRALYPNESCTDTLIRVAVQVGTLEGRPLGAAKIADYVKVPRETVRRRLLVMEKRGLVKMLGTKAIVPKTLLLEPARLDMIKATLKLHTCMCRSLAQIGHKVTSG